LPRPRTIAPTIVAIRSTEIDISAIVEAFFANPALPWLAGALMRFGGIFIIAQHQLWSSVAAVLISLLGWFLALRGLALLIAPQLYERAAVGAEGYPALVRGFVRCPCRRGLVAHLRRLDRQTANPRRIAPTRFWLASDRDDLTMSRLTPGARLLLEVPGHGREIPTA
jgi:hypothetical protein